MSEQHDWATCGAGHWTLTSKEQAKKWDAKTLVYRHQSRVRTAVYRRLDSGTAQRPSAYQMEHLSTPTRAMMCSAPTGLLKQLASFFG